ncbi:MAG: hypothetical protein RLZZ546_2319, partial [Bacteroidota bacterium]
NDLYRIFSKGIELAKHLDAHDEFYLKDVHNSWALLMALGAYEFYGNQDIKFLQILPTNNITLDTPNLGCIFQIENNPIWKYLACDWTYSVPATSSVITNLDVLKGVEPIREIVRWEEDEWEMFSSEGSEFD